MAIEIKHERGARFDAETGNQQDIVELYIDISPTDRLYFADYEAGYNTFRDGALLGRLVDERKAKIMAALKKIAPFLLETK